MMDLVQLALLFLGFAGLGLLLWRGGPGDRAAAAVMLMTVAASYAVEDLTWNGLYFGLMLVDSLAFVALWLIAERAGRWWIVLASAFQLVGVLAYCAPLLSSEPLAWALFTLIWGLWFLIVLTLFFGVWEVEADRRYALGGRDGSTLDDGGRARAAPSME